MKRIVLIIAMTFAVLGAANAQKVIAGTPDTLQGAETVTFSNITSTSSKGTLAIQALCTQLGGTSDGTLVLQGSVDGLSFTTLTETTGKFNFYPSDTLTITDGAVMEAVITNSPFKYYRWKGTGTASDTTLITPKHVGKLQ